MTAGAGTDVMADHRRAAVLLSAAVALVVGVVVAVWGVGRLPAYPPAGEAVPAPSGLIAYSAISEGTRCVAVRPVSGGDPVVLDCGEFTISHRWTDDGLVEVASEPVGDKDDVGLEPGEAVRVATYDPTTGEQIGSTREIDWQWPQPVRPTAADGRTADIGDRVGGLRITVEDRPHGEERTAVDIEAPDGYDLWSIAWSPDDAWLYAVDSARRVLLIDPDGVDGVWIIAEEADEPTWYIPGHGSTTAWW